MQRDQPVADVVRLPQGERAFAGGDGEYGREERGTERASANQY